MNNNYLVYLMSDNGGPTSYPEEVKYFKTEQELKEYEVFCKLKGYIYETFDLYNLKDKNSLFQGTING